MNLKFLLALTLFTSSACIASSSSNATTNQPKIIKTCCINATIDSDLSCSAIRLYTIALLSTGKVLLYRNIRISTGILKGSVNAPKDTSQENIFLGALSSPQGVAFTDVTDVEQAFEEKSHCTRNNEINFIFIKTTHKDGTVRITLLQMLGFVGASLSGPGPKETVETFTISPQ